MFGVPSHCIRRHYVYSHRLYDKRDLLVEAAKLPGTTWIYAQATEKSDLRFQQKVAGGRI